MEELLTQAGLTDAQAAVYAYLLDNGPSAPPVIARAQKLTRTNAYKVLESLQELDLAYELTEEKKLRYAPADPSALATLVANERNRVIALEESVKIAMRELRAKYRKSTASGSIKHSSGNKAIINAYETQAKLAEDIYFIKSRADIPFLGYETMSRIRHLAVSHKTQRYGITPDSPEVPKDSAIDRTTNLTRALVPAEAYTAPVEWSISGNEVLIIKFDGEGECIKIVDQEVADSLRQIWHIAASRTA